MTSPCIAVGETDGETKVIAQGNYREVLNEAHRLKGLYTNIVIYRFTARWLNNKFLAKWED